MESILLISDAAKEVEVESHVLRYWEEELLLPIKRNELGHRYYTKDDVERFKQIKRMKERGLQLKAIKMILKDGKLDLLIPDEKASAEAAGGKRGDMIHDIGKQVQEIDKESRDISRNSKEVIRNNTDTDIVQESREDKARRLQWLLQQLIRETLQENNKELCRDIRESVIKEMDYQFRLREEKEEERDRLKSQQSEDYYRKMDELLRKKSNLKKQAKEERRMNRRQKKNDVPDSGEKNNSREGKRHSIF